MEKGSIGGATKREVPRLTKEREIKRSNVPEPLTKKGITPNVPEPLIKKGITPNVPEPLTRKVTPKPKAERPDERPEYELYKQFFGRHAENMLNVYKRAISESQHVVNNDDVFKSNVSEKSRATVVDWLIAVHQNFARHQTLHLTVSMLDRYLAKCPEPIPRNTLQLVGVACLFIASKFEENFSRPVQDYVEMTDFAFTVKELLAMEVKIVNQLEFKIWVPTSVFFANYAFFLNYSFHRKKRAELRKQLEVARTDATRERYNQELLLYKSFRMAHRSLEEFVHPHIRRIYQKNAMEDEIIATYPFESDELYRMVLYLVDVALVEHRTNFYSSHLMVAGAVLLVNKLVGVHPFWPPIFQSAFELSEQEVRGMSRTLCPIVSTTFSSSKFPELVAARNKDESILDLIKKYRSVNTVPKVSKS